MKIEIDDDNADAILVANLADSYASISSMLKNGIHWHPDDVAMWEKLLPAMELVGNWYSTDFKAIVKKAKKKK